MSELAEVVFPSLKHSGNPPETYSDRGGDVIAYDRRSGHEVGSTSHTFLETTDVMLMNGLVRFWVGNRHLPAFLNFEVFVGGRWEHVGHPRISDHDVLLAANLERVTEDACTVRLDLRRQGPAYVTLRRGERGIRKAGGDALPPMSTALRTVRWMGTPPYAELAGVSRGDGLFDGSLHNSGGRARFLWPPMRSPEAWSLYRVWLPFGGNAGDGTGELDQWGGSTGDWGDGDWGGAFGASPGRIATIEDVIGEVGSIAYDNVAKKIVFTLGDESIQSTAISFAAGDPVRILARFSTDEGMALSVRVGTGATAHVSDSSAKDTGTSEGAYYAHSVGPTASGQMGGDFDQAMIFADRLTDAEAVALLTQTSRGAGLPAPEGRLIWFAPFDADPVASLGADDLGLYRRAMPSLGLSASEFGDTADLGLFLATDEPYDTPADVLAQFVVDNDQELALR